MELRLEQKGFSRDIAGQVLDPLVNYGYINDKAFARFWVEQRLAKRGFRGLKEELREKGVDTFIIDEILTEFGREAEYSAALKLAKKKVELSGGACPFLRLAGYLERRGFSYDVIGKVCRLLSDKGLA